MLQLAVTRDIEGASGFVNIRVADVFYLQSEQPYVVIHTKDALFYAPGTIKYFAQALESNGYNFFIADRGCLINANNIRQLDKTYNIAFFDTELNDKSKRCYFSGRCKSALIEFVAAKTGLVLN
ncbi:LytTR family DNA-binding domain-containing protein [Paenibacillus sacheonensis]|uniref:HTH LytTR-type domain-containing protein n=1 Tax=Paenibacillus sacheonensis TaxID=742054 RepID=A0A7X4YK96_9BACL|nr:LytTR family DNA-binding domain-containing protein [Paenibacillus sacheonensis]MBM7563808.1 DNA-binding LytR/AlgR family response regulator [Paenibacillus sacheonensis]NBC67842.1 hypothetical protein [Paenibacillus sacheonensis]